MTRPIIAILALTAATATLTGCGGGEAAVKKGEEALSRGDYAAAAKCFRKAAKSYPTSVPLFSNLGATLARTGDHQGAIAAFREVLRFSPGDIAASESLAAELRTVGGQDNIVKSHELLTETLELLEDPRDRARAMNSLSLTESALHRYDMALAHLLLALNESPDYAPTLYNLAKLCSDNLNLPLEAQKYMGEFCASPSAEPARKAKGRAFLANNSQAAALAEPPEHEVPPEVAADIKKGEDEFNKKNYPAAEALFKKALEADPRSYSAAINLANTLNATAKPQQAIEAYETAAAIDPGESTPVRMASVLAYNLDDTEAALRTITLKMLPKWPDDAPSCQIAAYAFAKQARYYESRVFADLYLAIMRNAGKKDAAFQGWIKQLPAVPFKP